jgi:N-acetyl-gamma-glutamyl-phosphate reductase
MEKIKVGIVGATGYAGEELIRILLGHPKVKINYLAAKIESATACDKIFPVFKGKLNLICGELDLVKLNKAAEVVFLAVPHGTSYELVPKLLEIDKIVIDLSADFRLKNVGLYKKWYHYEHKNKLLLEKAVYGLPEVYREKIKKAKLVANPGCYPTAAILAALPAVKNGLVEDEIIIDAKSGTSGAGRTLKQELLFSEVNESVRPYKVNEHQHSPEIEQELFFVSRKKIKIIFTPQLIPINRGILSCLYMKLEKKVNTAEAVALYKKFYKGEPFVRVLEEGVFPQVKAAQFTNYCDIGLKVDEETNTAIVISAIDNLTKGASGQAVQNLNIMMGWEETLGLI